MSWSQETAQEMSDRLDTILVICEDNCTLCNKPTNCDNCPGKEIIDIIRKPVGE